MSLQRVGGTGDQGIDLRGWWWLPSGAFRRQEFPKSSFSSSSATATPSTPTSESSTSSPNSSSSIDASSNASEWDVGGESSRMARLRVVAQCKAETKTLGSRIVRELEGVMAGLRANSEPFLPVTPRGRFLTFTGRSGRVRLIGRRASFGLIHNFIPAVLQPRPSRIIHSGPSLPIWLLERCHQPSPPVPLPNDVSPSSGRERDTVGSSRR